MMLNASKLYGFYWDLRGKKWRFAYPAGQAKYELTPSEPRRVQVVTKEGTKEGTFIQYGIDHVEYESGPGHFSTVIAEMDDGTVCNEHVSFIKFIKGVKNE